MTRLLYFTRTKERRREGGFLCLGMEEKGGLYSSSGKNMNRRSFNEGLTKDKKESLT